MGLSSTPLEVMLRSVVKLLEPGDLAPRAHGKRLIASGVTSMGIWLVTMSSVWLVSNRLDDGPSTPRGSGPGPGVRHADIGPAVGHARADHVDDDPKPPFVNGMVTRLLLVLFMALLLAVVCWGGYSSLAISAGFFEVVLDVPFRDLNPWFSRLTWPTKVVVFPVLLAGMFAILALPILLLGAAGWIFGLTG